MKTFQLVIAAWLCSLAAGPLLAQPAPAMGANRPNHAPDWGGRLNKLLGGQKAFSANVDIRMQERGDKTMPGKLMFDAGKSRFEIDLLQSAGEGSQSAAAHMKSLGMDKMIMISRPDKNVAYQVYPGLKSYVEVPLVEAAKTDEYQLQTTDLGKESVEGHPAIKRKAVLTDSKGQKVEMLIWSATDMRNFPIKLQEGSTTTVFKDIKFAKPEASVFDPPAGMTRYDSMQAMMQQEMMKRMGGVGQGAGQGLPPGHPPLRNQK